METETDMTTDIEPGQAVRKAKEWVASAYADEGIANIGLEEVRYAEGKWQITIGFNRVAAFEGVAEQVFGEAKHALEREYKVIVLSGADNSVLEMRNREAA